MATSLYKFSSPQVQGAAPAWLLEVSLSEGKQKELIGQSPFMQLISWLQLVLILSLLHYLL